MTKKVSIHQPQYFTWLGLLHKIANSDLFVILDNVQFTKRDYQHRCMYSTQKGPKYLTIPVNAKNHQIDHLEIRNLLFAESQNIILEHHFQTLRHRYNKTPGWSQCKDRLHHLLLESHYNTVYDLIFESMLFTFDLYKMDVTYIKASDLNTRGTKDELMLNITKEVDGDIYLSGMGAKGYMRDEIFDNAGIKVEYQQFTQPEYPQSHGGNFVKGCTALDFYFEAPNEAMKYAENFLW
ncbi:WbqC family protein [Ectobacillus polymachus]|uniref:WbqC family protein n=1 Tax=Ectobacillus polymachus TaxID=1508806 RepID=UPI003A8538AF